MAIGTVKFFNPGKGFGFITPDSGARDVFVPSASIATSGVALLKTGQRVSFEEMPDTKGPKAVNLKLLETPAVPRPPAAAAPVQAAPQATQVTLYCDPTLEESEDILAGLQDAGLKVLVVDYVASPPSRDRLKLLSSLLRGTDQSLVRRYDPLFHELRLDDRFISENDFWDAIVEHPTLINGPVVTSGARASICRSQAALKEFLAPPAANANGAQRKSLSPRLLKLMGQAVPEEILVETKAAPVAAIAPVPMPPVAAKPVKPAAKAKPAAKPVAKTRPVAKPKPAAKAAKAKAAAKPAKKPRRG